MRSEGLSYFCSATALIWLPALGIWPIYYAGSSTAEQFSTVSFDGYTIPENAGQVFPGKLIEAPRSSRSRNV